MRLSFVATAVAMVVAIMPSAGAVDDTSTGASRTTSTVRPSDATRKARRNVDVLTASRADVENRLKQLDESYQAQEAKLQKAREAVAEARATVAAAEARVADAEEHAEEARLDVRRYAVEAYVHPPAVAAMGVLSIADTQDAGFASDVLTIMAEERRKVVDDFEVKQKIAAMERDLADKAAAEAERLSADAEQELSRLSDLRSEQAGVMSDLDDRLGNALAEAAALQEIDAQAARELAERETELRSMAGTVQLVVSTSDQPARLVSTRGGSTDTTTTTAPPSNNQPTPGPTTTRPPSPTTTRPPSPTTTRPPSPTTTVKPPPPPAGVVTWADVVSVGGGIWVHRSIEANTRAMLNAATAAGFSLTGGGYRDSASQIATRMANCGTTYYDIYEKPSGQCTPPTAIPGRSMHERGLAMDLKANGALITSRSNAAFVWLSKNAARYGFYNLPSEPWHWSTNGH